MSLASAAGTAPLLHPDEVFLGLGCNLGDRRANLLRALRELQDGDLQVLAVSAVYESAAVGPVPQQPDFLNIAVRVRTALPPLALLDRCLEVEERLGRPRQRPVAKGPRAMDVDLLLYGALRARWGEKLVLPHPELTRRAFVLLPLLELNPDLQIPGEDGPLNRLAERLQAAQRIERLGPLQGGDDPGANRGYTDPGGHARPRKNRTISR